MIQRPVIVLRKPQPAPVRPVIRLRSVPTTTCTRVCRCGSTHTLNDVTGTLCQGYGGMSIILLPQV